MVKISNSLARSFAKAVIIQNGNDNTSKTLYGEVVQDEGVNYVRIDGSTELTPFSSVMDAVPGNRVSVTVDKGKATIVGNVSAPAQNTANFPEGSVNTACLYGPIDGDTLTIKNINASNITSGTIDASLITVTNIDASSIKAGAITTDKLDTNAVTAAKIASNAITTDKLDANAVTTDKLNANAVTAAKIASNAITTDKLDANAVTTDKLNANAVTAAKIASNAITADKIKAGVITSNHISTSGLSASVIESTSLNTAVGNVIDAVVDTAFIRDLVAGDITSLSTATQNLIIGSGDYGTIEVNGTLIQFKDNTQNHNVYIQLGKDAQGNNSLIVKNQNGATILDSSGITANAIADELIVNDMLKQKDANYTGISANRLNIDSVVTGINNGTSTINTSKIYFDEGSQTLNTKLSSMTSDISGINTNLSTNYYTKTETTNHVNSIIGSTTITRDGQNVNMLTALNNVIDTAEGHTQTISSINTALETKASASQTITSDTIHYLATSLASGVTTSTSGWSTEPQTMTSTNKYLWIYHTYTYADSTSQNPHTSNTTPVIGGVYGNTGAQGNPGTSLTITATSVTYQAGTSGTTKPTGTWSTTIPSVSAGQYLWTKTVVTYSDGTSTESYSVARQGANGTGVTISSTSVTYQAGTSETTAPTGTWSTTIPSVSAGQYLWTKTVVTYSNSTSTIAYSVARQGVNGTNGSDGTSVTVSSVQYAGSTSNTTAPTNGWQLSIPSVSAGQYLWTKTTYSDNNVAYSVARQGQNGSNGTSITISSTSITYQTSNSGTTAPTGTWSTSIPSVSAGQYLWTKTYVKYSDNTETTSYSVARTGTQGPQGVSVASVETLYYAHTGTTAPAKPSSEITSTSTGTGAWTKAVPTLTATNRYMYRCDQIKYSPSGISWSDVVLDNSLTDLTSRMTTAESKITDSAIVNTVASNMKNCGRNLLHGTSGAPTTRTFPTSGNYSEGEQYITSIIPTSTSYTVSFEAKSTVAGDKITNYFYSPGTTTGALTSQGTTSTAIDGAVDITLTTGWVRYWIKYTQTAASSCKKVLVGRCITNKGTGTVSIRKVQLEEGTVPTDWSVAPDEGINLTLDTLSIKSPTSYLCARIPLTKNLEAGKTYTLQLWDFVLDSGSSGLKGYWGGGSVVLTGYLKPTNGYVKNTFSITDANANGNGATNLWLDLYNFASGHSGSNCTIGKWKLEEGGAATPWSPAPVQIASMTKVEQLTDKISMIVANDSTSSSVVLTPDALTAIANNINLNGKVNFNDLTASAKSSIASNTLSNIYSTGTTTIDGGKITAGSITADRIHTNGLDASVIKSGKLSADRIDVDSLTAKHVRTTQNTTGGSLTTNVDGGGITSTLTKNNEIYDVFGYDTNSFDDDYSFIMKILALEIAQYFDINKDRMWMFFNRNPYMYFDYMHIGSRHGFSGGISFSYDYNDGVYDTRYINELPAISSHITTKSITAVTPTFYGLGVILEVTGTSSNYQQIYNSARMSVDTLRSGTMILGKVCTLSCSSITTTYSGGSGPRLYLNIYDSETGGNQLIYNSLSSSHLSWTFTWPSNGYYYQLLYRADQTKGAAPANTMVYFNDPALVIGQVPSGSVPIANISDVTLEEQYCISTDGDAHFRNANIDRLMMGGKSITTLGNLAAKNSATVVGFTQYNLDAYSLGPNVSSNAGSFSVPAGKGILKVSIRTATNTAIRGTFGITADNTKDATTLARGYRDDFYVIAQGADYAASGLVVVPFNNSSETTFYIKIKANAAAAIYPNYSYQLLTVS